MADEQRKDGRVNGDLSHERGGGDFRRLTLPGWQGMHGENTLQKLIELAGGDACRKRRVDLVDQGEQAADGIRLHRAPKSTGAQARNGKRRFRSFSNFWRACASTWRRSH